jgi:superfamily II DNA or RNA helicase
VIGASNEIYQKLLDFWSYKAPGAFFAPQHQLWLANKAAAKAEGDPDREVAGWDGKKYFMYADSGKLSAGLFRATWKEAEQALNIRFKIKSNRPPVSGKFKLGFSEQSEKYAYQNECADAMLAAMPRGGGIVLAATRAGKTRMVAQLFSKVTCSCLCVVDTIDLLYQTQTEIAGKIGEKVGVVGDQTFSPERVTVATIQTLQKHHDKPKFKSWFGNVEILVIDELHKAFGKRDFSLLKQVKPIACYGLTATLQLRKKDVRYRAYALCGPVIFSFPVKEGMETGVLTTGRAVQILFPALEGVSSDPAEAYREETIEHPTKLIAARRIVDSLTQMGRYVMVLVDRVAHVKAMSEMVHDIPHAVAYGAVNKVQRKTDRTLFDEGEIQCLIANRVYEKGITLKRVDVGLDLAELPNPNDCIQKFGRMAGLHEDKSSFIFFDFGTYGDKHRAKAARARASAFRREGLELKIVKIKAPLKEQATIALQIVEHEIKRDAKHRTTTTGT